MVADSIVITNSDFTDLDVHFFRMDREKDDKGYYNAEKIIIRNNNFDRIKGSLAVIYRGGNDESTLGPKLFIEQNKINRAGIDGDAVIDLTGVQVSQIHSNRFSGSNQQGILIRYKDIVRARHSLKNNFIDKSGSIEKNQFLTEKENIIK